MPFLAPLYTSLGFKFALINFQFHAKMKEAKGLSVLKLIMPPFDTKAEQKEVV